MPRLFVSLLLSATIASGPAWAETSPEELARAANPEDRAYLPVDDFQEGIGQWQADGRNALYLQGVNGRWHHVQLMEPCLNLPYTTLINFITDGGSRLDEFSSVLVRGQRCWFKSVEPSDGPPPKEG